MSITGPRGCDFMPFILLWRRNRASGIGDELADVTSDGRNFQKYMSVRRNKD